MMRIQVGLLSLAITAGAFAISARAQQINVATPMIGVNDSFYEHFNVAWRLRGGGPRSPWFLSFGTPNSVIPPFGGYDPNNDLRFGFGSRNFGLNFSAGTGSSRSITMASPSVTMMNGAQGQFFSGSVRPFVTGLIPVVGNYPAAPYVVYPPFAPPVAPVYVSPLAEKLERLRHEASHRSVVDPAEGAPDDLRLRAEDAGKAASVAAASAPSSAARGDISVAEIRRQQALEDEAKRAELERLIDEARTAERNGQWAIARVRYQQAVTRATGEQRTELLESLAKLKTQR